MGILSETQIQWLGVSRCAGGVHFWPGLGCEWWRGCHSNLRDRLDRLDLKHWKMVFPWTLGDCSWVQDTNFVSFCCSCCDLYLKNTNAAGLSAINSAHQPKQLKSSCRKTFGFPESHENPIEIPSTSHIPEVFQDSTTGQSTAKRKCCDSTCELLSGCPNRRNWLSCFQPSVRQKSESCTTYDLWYYVVSLLTFYCNHM